MLVAHPWLVAISPIQYRRLGPNAVRSAKQYVEALEPLGLEPSELWFVAGTVNDYLVGSAHRTANRPPGGELQDSIPESELQETPESSPRCRTPFAREPRLSASKGACSSC